MRRLPLSHLVLFTSVLLVAGASAAAQSPEPISDYKVGMAYPAIHNTWDVQPQIQLTPSTPHARLLHRPKLPPPPGERGDQDTRRPRIKRYGGFDATEQTPWSPPDPTLAVGPDHVLETVNMNLAWWDKEGTLQFSQRLDSTGNPGFFDPVGAGSFTFDPKCFYDEHADRFVVLALEVYSTDAYITLAVSDDDDPNGVWYMYRTDAVIYIGPNDFWVDYPGFGYDDQAYHVTGNLFGLSAGGWGGVLYRTFNKGQLLNGLPAVYTDINDGSSASVQVAQVHNAGVPPYFVSARSSTKIRVQSITDPLGSPTLHTHDVDVPWQSSPPNALNLGGSDISTLDGRIINADYRDGYLYAGHGVDSGGGNCVARWYEFETNGWPQTGSPTLSQSGDVDYGAGTYAWFPALTRTASGKVAMILAHSTASVFASIQYTWREPGDPAGTMRAPVMMKSGVSGYDGGRWGDYFDVAVDPVNDETVWGVGEYAKSSGSWGTWIGVLGTTPGTVTYIEPGYAGSGGLIPLLTVTDPVIGEDLTVSITNSIGMAPYHFLLGTSPGAIALKDITIHINPPWARVGLLIMQGSQVAGLGFDNRTGTMSRDPALVGAKVYLQALILDPQKLAATRAAELTFGDL